MLRFERVAGRIDESICQVREIRVTFNLTQTLEQAESQHHCNPLDLRVAPPSDQA
jgi:hypothetical protein